MVLNNELSNPDGKVVNAIKVDLCLASEREGYTKLPGQEANRQFHLDYITIRSNESIFSTVLIQHVTDENNLPCNILIQFTLVSAPWLNGG